MTVQLIHAADGYEGGSTSYRHVFADRDKALLVAHVAALTAATDVGHEIAVEVP